MTTRSITKKKVAANTWISWLIITAAMAFLVDAGWIHAKARLAQWLIADAWARIVNQSGVYQSGVNHSRGDEGGKSGGGMVKPWPWADTWPVARLQAPEYNVDVFVLDGAHGSALAFGPGRLHGTANPGRPGLSIVGGHRDTHFQFLRHVRIGDELLVTDDEGRAHHYSVNDIRVVNSVETPLRAAADEERLLLVTCYPFDALTPGGPLRYVVSAAPRNS